MKDLIRRICRWHRGRTRRLDQKYLWPQVKRRYKNVKRARVEFLNHAMQDPSWTLDLTNRQIADIVDCLE